MKDEILSYREMCNKLNLNTIQRGMNFRAVKGISIILMSVRSGAPYADKIDYKNNLLIYEGHDAPKRKNINPKQLDQPVLTENGNLTENGKFIKAIENYKRGLSEPEKVLVFDKLNSGIWSEKGVFDLIDYYTEESNGRKVLKFVLKPREDDIGFSKKEEIENIQTRIIPTEVKIKVWKRDKGKCIICESKINLHYDHDIPFSKGGSSITEKNVRILCAKCNLKKHDKIE